MLTASSQKYKGRPESANIVLAPSIKVLFFLSTTPFCSGVLATLNCLIIPLDKQKSFRVLFLNSVPLSLLIVLTGREYCFSTCRMKNLMISAASSLENKKNTHVNLE